MNASLRTSPVNDFIKPQMVRADRKGRKTLPVCFCTVKETVNDVFGELFPKSVRFLPFSLPTLHLNSSLPTWKSFINFVTKSEISFSL